MRSPDTAGGNSLDTWSDIVRLLGEIYSEDEIDLWSRTRQSLLGGKTPLDAWKSSSGREGVRNVVRSLADGNHQ